MTSEKSISENSQSVQSHLVILQNVIQRMSSNSTSSKAWCITLVSAILVIVADKGEPHYSLIALLPTILFFALDTYYLALENGFRRSYNDFIEKLHNGKLKSEDLFAVKPNGEIKKLFLKSVTSFSIYPFYGTLLIMIYLIKIFVM